MREGRTSDLDEHAGPVFSQGIENSWIIAEAATYRTPPPDSGEPLFMVLAHHPDIRAGHG